MSAVAFAVQTTPPTPGQRFYQPRGGAAELMACRAPEVLLEGPANTGKTRAVLEKVYTAAVKYPGMRALLLRKTRESLTESVLVTFEEKVLPDGSPLRAGPDRSRRQRYSLPNSSRIVVGGLDKASKVMSTEYDLVAVFEGTETTEHDLETLTTRLRNGVMPYQQLIVDCNPGGPTHYLNQRAADGRMTRVLSRHADNPTVTPAYLATLARLTGARRARLLEGRWAAQEGLVYAFDAAVHVVTDQDLAGWGIRLVAGRWTGLAYTAVTVDWGFTNPGVFAVWGVDGDGRLILLREWYRTGQTIDWWCGEAAGIKATYAPSWWACDPSEPAYLLALRRALGPRADVREANNAIRPGIDKMTGRMAVAGDGRPRLVLRADALVSRDPARVDAKRPVCMRDEFDGYIWPLGSDGHAIKEVPVKDDDHSMDVARYACMELDAPRASRKLMTW